MKAHVSTCPTTCKFLTTSPFVLFGPLIAQKNGNDAQNITDQKLLDVQSASSKEPQLWASNDVEDMLEDLSAQDILGPKEDLLAALERMPKSVTIEAAAQTKSKAPGKVSLPEPSEAGKVTLQGPSRGSLQAKTALPVPSQHSSQSVEQVSSETEAVRKVTLQTQSKDSSPVRSAGLAPNKLLVSGVIPSPTLSENLIPFKTVLPTESKNATYGVSTVPPSSKAAVERKAVTPSMSKGAAAVKAAESAQIQAGATGKAAVLAPSNTSKTSVGSPLASYKGTASYRTIMPKQSEADTQGRVAAWAPSKDIFSSVSTSSASHAARRSEGLVSVKISETVPSKDTSNMVSTFGKYAAPALSKVEFQGLAAPPITSEAALPVKDALPTFHKDGGQVTVPARVSGISSVLGKKSVTTANEAQDRDARAAVPKFSISGRDKGLGPVIDIAPTSNKDPFLLGSKTDSALGKAVALSTTADGANGRPSILSQSKGPVSVKDSVTLRGRDTAFGVAAARAPIKVTFSPSSIQIEKTSPIKAEEPVIVKALGPSMEPTRGKATVPTKTEFSGQDKFALPSPSMGQAFVKDTVPTPGFSEGSKLPTTVKAVPTLGIDAVSAAAPTLLSSIGSTLRKNTISSTNEATDVRAALPAMTKFEVVGQAAPSVPGECSAPITGALLEKSKDVFFSFASVKLSGTDTDSGKAVTLETTECATENKVSLPEPTKFLSPRQAVSSQPSEDPVLFKDSVTQPGRNGFLGVSAKTPTRVSFSGLAEPLELSDETVPVRDTSSEDDSGSALSFGTKQDKDAPQPGEDSVPEGTASPPETVKGLASAKATQPTGEDLFPVKSAVLTPEATPHDKTTATASDAFDQGENESDVTAKDKTIQNESSAHIKTLVQGESELLAQSQDFLPQPSKDYATIEVLPLAPCEVPPAPRELPVLGTTTVAVPEEDFGTVKRMASASNDASNQVATEKQATGEVLGPEGAAFPGQNKATALLEAKSRRDETTQGLASMALSLCLPYLLLKSSKI